MSVQGHIRLKGKGVVFESNTLAYHDHAVFRRVAKKQRVRDLYGFEVDEHPLERRAERQLPPDLRNLYKEKAAPRVAALVRRFRRSSPPASVCTVTLRGHEIVASEDGHRQLFVFLNPSSTRETAFRRRKAAYHKLIKQVVRQGYVEVNVRKDAADRIDELLRAALAITPDFHSDRRYEEEMENKLNRMGKWYPARQGLTSVEALLKYLTKNREELDTANNRATPEAALMDLQAIRRVLKKASTSGTPFRLFFS